MRDDDSGCGVLLGQWRTRAAWERDRRQLYGAAASVGVARLCDRGFSRSVPDVRAVHDWASSVLGVQRLRAARNKHRDNCVLAYAAAVANVGDRVVDDGRVPLVPSDIERRWAVLWDEHTRAAREPVIVLRVLIILASDGDGVRDGRSVADSDRRQLCGHVRRGIWSGEVLGVRRLRADREQLDRECVRSDAGDGS